MTSRWIRARLGNGDVINLMKIKTKQRLKRDTGKNAIIKQAHSFLEIDGEKTIQKCKKLVRTNQTL